MEIKEVIENMKLGYGVSLQYNTYIDFDKEMIDEGIKEYNIRNKTNFRIKNIKEIWDKYGTLYLSDGKNVIGIEGIDASDVDYKRSVDILYY